MAAIKKRPRSKAPPEEKVAVAMARATAEARAAAGLPPLPPRMMRKCLKCWDMFMSVGPQNRICRRCSGLHPGEPSY